ncbi:glycosyltransferase [Paeniglutamicibacter sp. Y32M11]|uniref:glycosyltransferase family protein n=1 Tax=Paeniglutamicibacter sp. Y32M11 TaxID=2853258 RepID=UPI001C532F28|nr:glycosyltransferase [Paeniglutamicibacter sp. Y32M11]QXQ08990.1 glycosyltransferase [Paeniglutamicibacter sp. Y32M11]
MDFEKLRTALWHLRKGGPRQLQTWRRRHGLGLQPESGTSYGREQGHGRQAGSAVNLGRAKAELNVAAILDEFSAQAWGPEWNLLLPTPTNWQEVLDGGQTDLLFVESAWAGNSGSWSYHLTGTSAPRQPLVEMVAAFREKGIPTVFWNKEDPPHFEDFLDAARLFDTVLTSDESMIPRYQQELGHQRVHTLSFAAQPELHNPVRSRALEVQDVAFAGMYFAHKYPERRDQMETVLGGALDAQQKNGGNLRIFSRQWGGEEKYQFPAPFDAAVVGSLPYEQMVGAYQDFKVFLNVNSVVDSPSMCARRIFEISACGTPVVSGESAAIGRFFDPEEVFEVKDREDARGTIRMLLRSPALRQRSVHLAQRRIWDHHTYSHRAASVLRQTGISAAVPSPFSMNSPRVVTVIAATRRPGKLPHLLQSVAKQLGVHVQLVLIAHGFEPDAGQLNDIRDTGSIGQLDVLVADGALSLGECLNQGIDMAEGDFIAKMDDDDFYGVNYLSDQVSALRFSGADVVGKQAHYMYLEGLDLTLLRNEDREHRFTDLVMGPTLLGTKALFDAVRFTARSRGEDTEFLGNTLRAGARIYSTDRFNFLQFRGKTGEHTWKASERSLAATGEVAWFGRNDSHVFF